MNSTITTIHIGCYLVCKQQVIVGDPHVRMGCPKSTDHRVMRDGHFCPTCGTLTELISTPSTSYRSLCDIVNQYTRACAEVDFLGQNFQHIPSAWIDYNRPGYEIVGYRMRPFDGDYGRMYTVDVVQSGFTSPPQDVIDQLIEIVGYEHVEIKFGVLVSVD